MEKVLTSELIRREKDIGDVNFVNSKIIAGGVSKERENMNVQNLLLRLGGEPILRF